MSQPNHANSPEDRQPAEFSTTGMLLKLVLLPGLVVLLLSLMIVWLTRPTLDPDRLLDKLARDGPARWHAAVNLAAVLHDPGSAAINRDPAVARRLSNLLQQEIQAARMEPQEIQLRVYMCRALGEFHLAEPLPVLITAARTERNEKEADVRRAAIEAIAVLAANVREAGTAELRSNAQLLPCLLAAAEDRRTRIRSAAAFTLGVLGGDRAQACLEALLADRQPEVRYNAATGLARHGNPKCIKVLLQMLDPHESATGDLNQTIVITGALQATSRLAAANPKADLSGLAKTIDRLTRTQLGPQVRAQAREVLRRLRGR